MTPRLFPILAVLRNGVTVTQLEKRFRLARKTIYRDLDELRELGFDLREQVEAHGSKVWRVVKLDSTLRSLTSD